MGVADKHIFVDDRLESYGGYLPEEWAWGVSKAAACSPVLDEFVLDLVLDWRTTSYTAAMPAIAVRAVQQSLVGYAGCKVPERGVRGLAAEMLRRLARRVPELTKNRGLRSRTRQAVEGIAAEVSWQTAGIETEVPIDPLWKGFLDAPAFKMSLWSSQRVAFVAFYNAYESFLIRCLKHALAVDRLRTSDKEFKAALKSAVGADLTDVCWAGADLNLARTVRHALSHNGGRETEDLKRLGRHGFVILGGVLQIVPEDNHKLVGRLRRAADAITVAASRHEAFSPSPHSA